MTDRYYYDDPLSAAWMEKHFGMKFEDVIEVPADCGIKPLKKKSYIHSISLHILVPQAGDLFKALNYYRIINSDAGCSARYRSLTSAQVSASQDDMECQIIQRNGIPFHWPKKETI